MKTFAVLVVLVYVTMLYAAEVTTKCYDLPSSGFDGRKFMIRYSLPENSFYVARNQICLRPGVVLADDPPIFESPDAPEVVSRRFAKEIIDREKVLKAIVLIILDEFNAHALKINSILDAMDAATSLADLKTRIAAIPDYPQRTQAQLISAIKNKIDSGDAD